VVLSVLGAVLLHSLRPTGVPGMSPSSATWRTSSAGCSRASRICAPGDGGEVLLRGHLEVLGVGSGVDVWGEVALLSLYEAGRMNRVRAFFSWREGLEAAGLSR
jgi:hypothetical protein